MSKDYFPIGRPDLEIKKDDTEKRGKKQENRHIKKN
jgi:hypothetical protein